MQVSALINHERLEMSENSATVVRQYTERLISDAVTHGSKHKHTMEMVNWWLEEDKAAIHKLFKVCISFEDHFESILS